MNTLMPARAARKLITPGTVKQVMFRFDAIGGNADGKNTGWLRVPKVEAKRLLRDLYPGSTVRAEVCGGFAYIAGEVAETTIAGSSSSARAPGSFPPGDAVSNPSPAPQPPARDLRL